VVCYSHYTIIVEIIWTNLAEYDLLNSGVRRLQTAVPLFCDMTLHHSIIISQRLQTNNLSQNIINKIFNDVASYPKGRQSQIHGCENRQNFKLHAILECVSFLSGSRWHFRGSCYIAAHIVNNTKSWFKTFAVYWILYAFFWVIPRRLKFICRRFGTFCVFHLHRQESARRFYTHLPVYEDGTDRVFRNVGI